MARFLAIGSHKKGFANGVFNKKSGGVETNGLKKNRRYRKNSGQGLKRVTKGVSFVF